MLSCRDVDARSPSPWAAFQRYGVATCLVLAALSAGLMTLADAGATVPQPLFLMVWILLWAASIAAWLGMPWLALRRNSVQVLWPYAIVSLMVLYVSVRLVASSFAVDDELTSWNYWAEQHFLGVSTDFSFTKAAYPQLFPAWIGSIYRAVGSYQRQWAARVSIALITLWFGLLMMRAADGKGRWGAWVTAALLPLLWLSGFRVSFERGLADPLMVVALLASIHYFLCYARDPRQTAALVFCVALAVVASYTKQPALIWGCLGLPLLGAWQVARGAWKRWTLGLVLSSAAISAAWPLWFGRGFTHNHGVITRSLGGRGTWEQLGHSALVYLIDRPVVLLVMATSLVLCWPKPVLRGVWLVVLLPSTVAWFIWGAYSLRLGLHVLGLAALLLLHAMKDAPSSEMSMSARSPRLAPSAALATLIAIAGTAAVTIWRVDHDHIDLRHGPEMTLRRYFGADAELIEAIYRSKVPIWVSSNYLHGMFYGANPVTAPRAVNEASSRDGLLRELVDSDARYAFSAGVVPYGPSSLVLEKAVHDCPDVFREITRHGNSFNFHVYQVDALALRGGLCRD